MRATRDSVWTQQGGCTYEPIAVVIPWIRLMQAPVRPKPHMGGGGGELDTQFHLSQGAILAIDSFWERMNQFFSKCVAHVASVMVQWKATHSRIFEQYKLALMVSMKEKWTLSWVCREGEIC